MKKIFQYSVLFVAVMSLVACGTKQEASDNGSVSNSKFEISVKDGMYIQPSDEDSSSHYLALQVEIKNNQDQKFNFITSDITLYNDKDEKIEPIQIYESDSKTKFLEYGESIAKGKSVAGYVVYEVDKDAQYELHFSPSDYEDEKESDKDKDNDVSIKLDPSIYEDNIDQVKDLVKNYVDAVYLDGENTSGASNISVTDKNAQIVPLVDNKKTTESDKKSDSESDAVTNDVKADREEFIKKFEDTLEKGFFSYKPSSAELRTFVESYIKVNAKRAKVEYNVKTYLPDYAVVYVRPETIDLKNLNVYELSRKYYEENKETYNNNFSEALKAGEKFVLENMPSQFESIPLDTPDHMDREGFEIKMTKKDGKWTIDTSSRNYELNSLSRAFRGGFGY